MYQLYLASLVIGGGMLAISLVGGMGDADVHHDGIDGGEAWGKLFSLRMIFYFLFGFGVVGVADHVYPTGMSDAMVGAAAVGFGVITALVVNSAFGALSRSESGAVVGDQEFEGMRATVTLPISNTKMGKIEVNLAGRLYSFPARPHQPLADREPDWTPNIVVVVVEMRSGTAYVRPV